MTRLLQGLGRPSGEASGHFHPTANMWKHAVSDCSSTVRSVTALIPSHVRGPQNLPSCAVHRTTALSSLHPTSHGKPKQPGGDTGKVRVKRNPRSRSVSVADAGRCGQTVSVVFLLN